MIGVRRAQAPAAIPTRGRAEDVSVIERTSRPGWSSRSAHSDLLLDGRRRRTAPVCRCHESASPRAPIDGAGVLRATTYALGGCATWPPRGTGAGYEPSCPGAARDAASTCHVTSWASSYTRVVPADGLRLTHRRDLDRLRLARPRGKRHRPGVHAPDRHLGRSQGSEALHLGSGPRVPGAACRRSTSGLVRKSVAHNQLSG